MFFGSVRVADPFRLINKSNNIIKGYNAMTELTKRFIENTQKITLEDITSAAEITALVLMFLFCVMAITPII